MSKEKIRTRRVCIRLSDEEFEKLNFISKEKHVTNTKCIVNYIVAEHKKIVDEINKKRVDEMIRTGNFTL